MITSILCRFSEHSLVALIHDSRGFRIGRLRLQNQRRLQRGRNSEQQ